jgi:hypothetical protein
MPSLPEFSLALMDMRSAYLFADAKGEKSKHAVLKELLSELTVRTLTCCLGTTCVGVYCSIHARIHLRLQNNAHLGFKAKALAKDYQGGLI